jgi:hypothetical protein
MRSKSLYTFFCLPSLILLPACATTAGHQVAATNNHTSNSTFVASKTANSQIAPTYLVGRMRRTTRDLQICKQVRAMLRFANSKRRALTVPPAALRKPAMQWAWGRPMMPRLAWATFAHAHLLSARLQQTLVSSGSVLHNLNPDSC